MNIKEVRKYISSIKGSLFKNSNSYSIGNLKSHFKGTGLQFKEHQVYSHGDDVRFIDWKILAKTSIPYVKTFEEERNVEIVVVIDASPSMFMGHDGISKIQASIEITCLLYLLASQTNDYVHAIVLFDQVYNLPAKNGDEGVILLTSLLEKIGIVQDGKVVTCDKIKKEALGENVIKPSDLLRHLKKKREVVLLSDFNNFLKDKDFEQIVNRLNLHCFQVLSPIEIRDDQQYRLHGVGFSGTGSVVSQVGTRLSDLKERYKKGKVIDVSQRYLESFVKEML